MPSKRKESPQWRWRTLEQFDPGLRVAIVAAGGTITSLARLIGIAPQAIAQWTKVPADRIIEIERATGVDRERLRPDLYRRYRRAG